MRFFCCTYGLEVAVSVQFVQGPHGRCSVFSSCSESGLHVSSLDSDIFVPFPFSSRYGFLIDTGKSATSVMMSQSGLALLSSLVFDGCWWIFCQFPNWCFAVVISGKWNVGHSALAQLYLSLDYGGTESIELRVSSKSPLHGQSLLPGLP